MSIWNLRHNAVSVYTRNEIYKKYIEDTHTQNTFFLMHRENVYCILLYTQNASSILTVTKRLNLCICVHFASSVFQHCGKTDQCIDAKVSLSLLRPFSLSRFKCVRIFLVVIIIIVK